MGCDIHMTAEVRRGGKWEYEPSLNDKLGNYRNYDVFSILAGVRSRSDSPQMISPPRGLPRESSSEIAAAADAAASGDSCDVGEDGFYLGDHSYSWLTLREIVEWPMWDEGVTHHGVMEIAEWLRWKRSGDVWPRSWCQAAGGGTVVVLDLPKEFDPETFVAEARAANPGKSIYIRDYWRTSYRDAAGCLWKGDIPLLQKLGDPADVRIVFGFDS